MPKATIERLITDLHARFGDELTSPQQQALLEDVQRHIHGMNEQQVDPGFQETVAVLLDDLEDKHPKAAEVVREMLVTLQNIGI